MDLHGRGRSWEAVRRHGAAQARGGGASLKGFSSRGPEQVINFLRFKTPMHTGGVRRIVRRFASTAVHLSGRKHCGRGVCLDLVFGKWLDSGLDSKLHLGRLGGFGAVLEALGDSLGAVGAVLEAS